MAISNPPKSHQSVIDQRRALVSELVARRLTRREITAAVETAGLENPETGKPWTLGTIQRDIKALEDYWLEVSYTNIDLMKAQINAQYEAVKRQAWKDGDLLNVMRALKAQRDLFGADRPSQINVNVTDYKNQIIEIIRTGEIKPDEVITDLGEELARELFYEAGVSFDV